LTSYYLPLYGAARLERGGEALSLRRKPLAMLYYLALEGATRREQLAELLWPHGKGAVNLRAGIYYLRKKFGLRLAARAGLLTLPAGVALDISRQSGGALEGLEGITPDFDAWITRKRFELEYQQQPRLLRSAVRRLAAGLPVPGLWILAGPIGTGKRRLARALADELELPFREGWRPGDAGIVYLEEPLPAFEELGRPRDWPRVLVVARPALGEEPGLLLGLRAVYPAERTRFLQVPGLGFAEAAGLLGDLPFADAARYYLRSHGRDELLEEMVRAGHEMPLKYRAIYRIESRRLRRRSRLALEHISVCPEQISPELARRMGSEEDLEELERRGWLVYDRGWRFADPVARRALEYDLPGGLKARYHQRAATAWEEAGKPLLAAWHRQQAGGMEDPAAVTGRGDEPYPAALFEATGEEPPNSRVGRGRLMPLLESARRGVGLEAQEGSWLLLRPEFAGEAAWLEFEALESDAVLHVSGELHVFAPLAGALQGRPPLAVHLGEGRFFLAPARASHRLPEGWLLPASGRFAYSFLVPAGVPLALVSAASEVAAKLEISAYELSPGGEEGRALKAGLSRGPAPGTPPASADPS